MLMLMIHDDDDEMPIGLDGPSPADCKNEHGNIKPEHGVALSNVELLRKWRLLPLHLEAAARKVSCLQSMVRNIDPFTST